MTTPIDGGSGLTRTHPKTLTIVTKTVGVIAMTVPTRSRLVGTGRRTSTLTAPTGTRIPRNSGGTTGLQGTAPTPVANGQNPSMNKRLTPEGSLVESIQSKKFIHKSIKL